MVRSSAEKLIIGDLNRAIKGISCIGLSITLSKDIIVLISIDSKYPDPVSA